MDNSGQPTPPVQPQAPVASPPPAAPTSTPPPVDPPAAAASSMPPVPVGKKPPYAVFIAIGLIVVVLIIVVAFVLPGLNKQTEEVPVEEEAVVEEIEEPTPVPDEEADVSEGMSILITSPADNSTVTTASVTVSGTAAPLADVFVNDQELKANNTGAFTTTVTLDEGENVIDITANDADGNYAEKQITVTYEPAE